MTAPDTPAGQPDETLALVVVITGVIVLAGSETLHVVWLIIVGGAALLSSVRRPPRESTDEPSPPT